MARRKNRELVRKQRAELRSNGIYVRTMAQYREGSLKTGNGKQRKRIVKSPRQAMAIAAARINHFKGKQHSRGRRVMRTDIKSKSEEDKEY